MEFWNESIHSVFRILWKREICFFCCQVEESVLHLVRLEFDGLFFWVKAFVGQKQWCWNPVLEGRFIEVRGNPYERVEVWCSRWSFTEHSDIGQLQLNKTPSVRPSPEKPSLLMKTNAGTLPRKQLSSSKWSQKPCFRCVKVQKTVWSSEKWFWDIISNKLSVSPKQDASQTYLICNRQQYFPLLHLKLFRTVIIKIRLICI